MKALISRTLWKRLGYSALIVAVSFVGLALICIAETCYAIGKAVASEFREMRETLSTYWKEGSL